MCNFVSYGPLPQFLPTCNLKGKLNYFLIVCFRLNHVAAGLVSPNLKSDTSSKEIEEAMKRVREAQSLISAAIEPGNMFIHIFLER